MRNVHEEEGAACNHCGTLFMSVERLTEHREVKHGASCLPCDQCGKQFEVDEELVQHKQTKHAAYFCIFCGLEFVGKDSLGQHMHAAHSTPSLDCGVCPKEFSEGGEIEQHLMTSHVTLGYSCPHCGRGSMSWKKLGVHMRENHFRSPSSTQCLYCKSRFASFELLTNHMRGEHIKGGYSCSDCRLGFESRNSLGEHMTRMHTVGLYTCPHCGETDFTMLGLEMHMSTNHGEEGAPIREAGDDTNKAGDEASLSNVGHSTPFVGSDRLACGQCDFVTYARKKNHRNGNVQRHMKNSHPGAGHLVTQPMQKDADAENTLLVAPNNLKADGISFKLGVEVVAGGDLKSGSKRKKNSAGSQNNTPQAKILKRGPGEVA